jgi:hypothetical protein
MYLQEFEDHFRVARAVASRLIGSREIDYLSNDRQDYTSMLALQGLSASKTFQLKYGFDVEDRKKYVAKSMWNQARKFTIANWRRGHRVLEFKHDIVRPKTYDDVLRFEAREALKILSTHLPKHEWEVLLRVGESNGNLARAYDKTKDGSIQTFGRTVRRLREKALQLLKR